MLSEKILLLPTIFKTLSAVSIVVANNPISLTSPVAPPAETRSPTLNGRKIIKNVPAAKFANNPPHAAPIAMPTAARSAAMADIARTSDVTG
jgi:hypothetical protein